VDAAGQLAQLFERALQPLGELVDERPGVRVVDARLEQPQLEGERDELLLRAVVQVALDAAARLVGRRDDAQPRLAELLEAGPQVGLQQRP
jgi:hypothetical protein